MHNEDQQLLRRFATDRDEAAFETLVRRHLGLVLGAARRQLAGDHHAAEDVAQQVFTSLAQKASRLLKHDCLEAWLHTATRFACQTHIRAAIRRERREREAFMNLTGTAGEPLWEQVAPVLDEALCELGEKERSLILMRHVTQQTGEEMAARLGVSESAVRKRLERALGRLRQGLARRGIAIGIATLVGAMEQNGQAQVAPGLVKQIAGHSAAQAGVATGIAAWLVWWKPGAIVGAVGLACAVAILLPRMGKQAATPQPMESALPTGMAVQPEPSRLDTPTGSPAREVLQFALHVLDAETHQPLTHASATFWVGYDEDSQQRIDERAWASNGLMQVTWTNDCFRFLAQVECDGYADTWMEWVREQGLLPVPQSYTLLMERAPAIGGVVVDGEGRAVPSANVAVEMFGDDSIAVSGTRQPALSHPAGWLTGHINDTTDANGRWAVRRIGRAVQNHGMTIVVTHPDYLEDRSDVKLGSPLAALQAGTYRSVLVGARRLTVSGTVCDSEGNPLPNARVTDGTLFSNRNVTTGDDQHLLTDTNGGFSFAARLGRRVQVTAKANGFAARTVSWSGQPLAVTLKPGRMLRLRVVGPEGQSIPGIRVESTPFQNAGGSETNQSTRYQLEATTDTDGRVEWADVPAEPLLMMFWSDSPHYLSRGGEVVHPDEMEQTIVLTPALKVVGTVTDAESGAPVPLFRVASVAAYSKEGIPPAPAFALPDAVSGKPFEDGRFEVELKPAGGPIAPSLRGRPERQKSGVYLKVTAPGYAAHTTRFLDVQERRVELQVPLKRALTTRVQVINPAGQAVADAEVVANAAGGGLESDRGAWKLSGA